MIRILYKIYLKIKNILSILRIKIFIILNYSMDKYCCACDKKVPDFYFFNYRPFGCPYCKSSPRERFVMYAFKNQILPIISKKMHVLHIAPSEINIKKYFKSKANWIGADIQPNKYGNNIVYLNLINWDINKSFNIIYASHVLEHIENDKKALQNIYDHLVPGGYAIILVPILGDKTIEGKPNLSPKERAKKFGQHDHVRQYGMDIIDRFQNVGFHVTIIDACKIKISLIKQYQFETHSYLGNIAYDQIFLCQRT